MNLIPAEITTTTNGALYLFLTSSFAAEPDGQITVPVAGQLKFLTVKVQANTKDGATVLTARLNGVDTALEITVPAGTAAPYTDTATVACNANDLVALELDTSASSSGSITLSADLEFEPTPTNAQLAATDTALQNNINTEASTREAADDALDTAITDEATARSNADTTLQSNIDTEATTRSNDDAAEASARSAADTILAGQAAGWTSDPAAITMTDPNRNVGVGAAAPREKLQVSIGAAADPYCDGRTWVNACSRENKQDIRSLTAEDLQTIAQTLDHVDIVEFSYHDDESGRRHVGVIAEDLPPLLADRHGTGVDTADAIGFLLAVVKHQARQIRALERHVTRLGSVLS